MTIATLQKEITGLRADIVELTLIVKQRLTVPPPAAVPPVKVDSGIEISFPNLGPLRTDSGDGMSNDAVWWVEQKAPGRATVVLTDRGNALRLHTEPGDSQVSGSGLHERNDVALRGQYEMFEGFEGWFSHSICFPDDFAIPPSSGWGLVFDFHDTRNQGGQANLQIFVGSGGLTLRGYAGQTFINDAATFTYGADLGPIVKNVWYDFTYHVKWSQAGFFDAWVNGKRKLSYVGPTLYQGYGVFLKLANYHSAFGKPSSVIHGAIKRGKTAQSVTQLQLE